MEIRPIEPPDLTEWLRMRLALWPDHTAEEHRAEMNEILLDTDQSIFVAVRPGGGLCGFLEASIHVNTYGTETSPVGYIEGWYVDADVRRQGVGGMLVKAAEAWTVERGFREIASDCEIDNLTSLQAHLALGDDEVERLIHFHKVLEGAQ